MNHVLSRNRPIRVLVVDDSPMMCKAIERILIHDEDIEVGAKALSGKEALRALSSSQFDVCTLDVHMPGMNGLSVLKNIMVKYPLPTLMVSAFTGDGSKITFEALRFGAVDFFKKPARNGSREIEEQADILRDSLKRASRVQVGAARYLRMKPVTRNTDKFSEISTSGFRVAKISIIYGATGSYSSVLSIIPFLNVPQQGSVVVSMEVSAENLSAFVDYLQPYSQCPLSVVTDALELHPSHVYFLPASYAAHFEREGQMWAMTVKNRPIESEKEGAIDLTLLSASEAFGNGVLSIFVSGDSYYGITGANEVLRNKGTVVVQKPSGCLAPGNVETVIERFGATGTEPYELAKKINEWMI